MEWGFGRWEVRGWEEGNADCGTDCGYPEGELLLDTGPQEDMLPITTECLSQRHEAGDQPGPAGGLVYSRGHQAAHEAAEVAHRVSAEFGDGEGFVGIFLCAFLG